MVIESNGATGVYTNWFSGQLLMKRIEFLNILKGKKRPERICQLFSFRQQQVILDKLWLLVSFFYRRTRAFKNIAFWDGK